MSSVVFVLLDEAGKDKSTLNLPLYTSCSSLHDIDAGWFFKTGAYSDTSWKHQFNHAVRTAT